MNTLRQPKATQSTGSEVRVDYVPAEQYTSPEFLKLEKERLWPKVWQMACREEELPQVGSYATYDIMDESIVVVRTSETEFKAFYNVCQHRGRRLLDGFGKVSHFHCRFHGWQFKLDGSIARVLDRQDWDGCPDFADKNLGLAELKLDTWGGWVFVNPDPDCKPLAEFLDEVPKYLDPFQLEKMRYRWYASVKVPCNWKVALEAFDEAYHVSATHPQWMPFFGDDTSRSRTYGPHGMFSQPPNPDYPMGSPSPRLNLPKPKDLRRGIVEFYEEFNQTLRAFFSERDVEATYRILTEVPADAGAFEILGKALEFQREAAIAAGAGWPDMSTQQYLDAGIDWHLFPNLIILPYFDAALAYRALPHPTDPDSCIFQVFSLQRYAPGAEPPLRRQYLHGDDDWRKFKDISIILQQDFDNMGEVQKGMKSKGFRGSRTSPMQESVISNFHRAICEYIDGE